jgi:hypothetical protein
MGKQLLSKAPHTCPPGRITAGPTHGHAGSFRRRLAPRRRQPLPSSCGIGGSHTRGRVRLAPRRRSGRADEDARGRERERPPASAAIAEHRRPETRAPHPVSQRDCHGAAPSSSGWSSGLTSCGRTRADQQPTRPIAVALLQMRRPGDTFEVIARRYPGPPEGRPWLGSRPPHRCVCGPDAWVQNCPAEQ